MTKVVIHQKPTRGDGMPTLAAVEPFKDARARRYERRQAKREARKTTMEYRFEPLSEAPAIDASIVLQSQFAELAASLRVPPELIRGQSDIEDEEFIRHAFGPSNLERAILRVAARGSKPR